jgi:hypothetical protein
MDFTAIRRRCTLCASEILGHPSGAPEVCLICRLAAEESSLVLCQHAGSFPREAKGGWYCLENPFLALANRRAGPDPQAPGRSRA